MKKLWIFLALLLSSCSKYYLSLNQQFVDRKYLASSHVNTPDPRQATPPKGQLIHASWKIPQEIYELEPKLIVRLLFWNYTEKEVEFPLETKVGQHSFFVIGDEYKETKGVLTYMAKIVLPDGSVYKEWKQQLWVELIQIDEDEQVDLESI